MLSHRYILVLSIATVLGTIPGAATAAPSPDTGLEAPVQQLEDDAWADGIAGLAEANDASLPARPTVDGPAHALSLLSHGDLDTASADAVLDEVPETLASPVERLLVGMAEADALVQAANAEHDATIEDVLEMPDPWIGAQTGPAEPAPTWELTTDDPGQAAPYIAAEIALAEAVQDAIDGFRTAEPTGTPADGCSVHQAPYLVICGEADHHHTSDDDAILVVDLGGNDDYDNAQGTPFSGGLAQVIVDVAGDDTYERSAQTSASTLTVAAQGAGVGGVGGIVDLQGDDRYTARARYAPGSDEAVTATTLAQGVGVLGAGLLVDLAGTDCVSAHANGLGDAAAVLAQGAAELGAGLAVLQGAPADARACPGGPSATSLSTPLVTVDTSSQYEEVVGPALTVAQGGAQTGLGALVGGPSDDTYTAHADGGIATTIAQGAGTGAGALVDPGGSDTYDALATAETELRASLKGYYSIVRVTVTITLGDTATLAQGAGLAGAAALLDAGLGDDTYRARTSTRAVADAKAITTYSGGIAEATADVEIGETLALAQGATQTGAGLLVDGGPPDAALGGEDTYTIDTQLTGHTNAYAGGGSDRTATATTTTDDARANGQGLAVLGVGALADSGGNDAYRLTADVDATARANAEGDSASETVNDGDSDTRGQALGSTGAGVLVDLTGDDTYERQPGATGASDDTCWTNSPGDDTNVGLGLDLLTGTGPPTGCTPPGH